MKIDIWYDYSCPFCYIAKRNFEAALEQFAYKDIVEIQLHSYEMMPGYRPVHGTPIYQFASERSGMSLSQTKQAYAGVADRAEKAGITYDFDKIILANTFDAHRLTHYANTQGRALQLAERIFQAYFTDGLDINDHSTLVVLAKEAGLDEAKAMVVLQSSQYADKVQEDKHNGLISGVQSVPFYWFAEAYTVKGAQEIAVFQEFLQNAYMNKQDSCQD